MKPKNDDDAMSTLAGRYQTIVAAMSSWLSGEPGNVVIQFRPRNFHLVFDDDGNRIPSSPDIYKIGESPSGG